MKPRALLDSAQWRKRWDILSFQVLALAAAVLCEAPAFALNPTKATTQYVHAAFGTEAGLPQSSVHAIAQTPDGYLWIGTQDGLARFDGLRFKVFSNRDTEAFRENFVSSLLVGHHGALWVGTDGGTLLRYADGRFERGPTLSGHSNGIRSMCESPDGSLFVASLGNGVHRIVGNSITTYTKADGLPDDVVMAVACDQNGGVWVGTAAGLVRLENGRVTAVPDAADLGAIGALTLTGDGVLWIGTISGAVVQIEKGKVAQRFGRDSGLPSTRVVAMHVDRDGSLWIGNEGAAITRFRMGEVATFGKAQGLTDDAALALFEDREGSLWIGTEAGGLNVLKESRFVAWGVREGLSSDDIGTVLETKDGALLFGGHNGLVRLAKGKVTNFEPKDGFPEWVDALLEDPADDVWVGSMRGALFRYRRDRLERVEMDKGLPNEGSRSIYKDRAGVIWAGAPRGRLLRLEGGQWSQVEVPGVGTAILAVSGDRSGDLWVGTYSEGIRHRSSDGTWTAITTAQGLSNDMVIGFYEDAEGTMWIATHGGLTRSKNGRLRAITARDGLFHDTVYQVVEDDDGYFWMCSDRGISKTPRSELDAVAEGRASRVTYRSFGLADGMRSVECNNGSPSGYKGHDGRLYFATLGGALVVDPKVKSFGSPPPIALEEVVANGTVAYVQGAALSKGRLELAPGLKNLEFQYATPSFIDPAHVHARYRLAGFDRDWVDAGLRRTAYYTNLPPGRYRFEVSACNADLVCSEIPAALEMKLLPRFYETLWFWLATATVLILAAAGGVRYRIRQIEKANVELENRVRERTEQLRTALVALEEKDERIQGDLKQAEAFQRALLPSLPEGGSLAFSAWYEPAEVVGGDIYDVAEVRDKVFRIFIADTTGHGVQASLRTIAIKTEYDRLKSTHASPGELLGALNQRLVDTYDGSVCGSACCVDIHVGDGAGARLVYANAAHPELLLLRRERCALYTPGMYLGFLREAEYPDSDAELAPGEALLLYSDGATEIDGGAEGMLGSDRLGEWVAEGLADALSPQNVLERVRSNMSQYSTKNGRVSMFEDDVTLILVSLKTRST